MGLTRVRLGQFIEEVTERNSDSLYGTSSVRGIVKDKEIRPTSKAKTDGDTIKKFLIVRPNEFVYNPRTDRMGGVIGIALNDTSDTLLFSFNNIAFRFTADGLDKIIPRWLLLYFKRTEFDRYVRFNSWGSATQLFTISDMFDVVIDLPPIEIQRKYVAIYESMLANQHAYEGGLKDLKLTCDAFIERLIREMPQEAIGRYIEQSDERNASDAYEAKDVRGLSVNKNVIATNANLDGVSLANYKVLRPGELAYVADTSRRGEKISIAFNDEDATYITSAINTVFRIRDDAKNRLLPGYLMLFFGRSEFDRYARFNSWGSARETFDWDEMCDVRIPVPDIATQRYAVALYSAWRTRTAINKRLKAQLREICPILIRGSIEEA
jgi:type I restriction enzyme S subunit